MKDMSSKYFENLIGRIVENHFEGTVCNTEIKEDYPLIMFKVETSRKGYPHTYRGYLGVVGDLVVTGIDNKKLKPEDYVSLT